MTKAACSRRLQHLQAVLVRWKLEQHITGVSLHELLLECLIATLIARKYVREDLLGINEADLKNSTPEDIKALVAAKLGIEVKGELAHKKSDAEGKDMVTTADKITQEIIQRILMVRYASKVVDEDEWYVDEKGNVFHFEGLVEIAKKIITPPPVNGASNKTGNTVADYLPFTLIGEEEPSAASACDDGTLFKSFKTKPNYHENWSFFAAKPIDKSSSLDDQIEAAIHKCVNRYLPDFIDKLAYGEKKVEQPEPAAVATNDAGSDRRTMSMSDSISSRIELKGEANFFSPLMVNERGPDYSSGRYGSRSVTNLLTPEDRFEINEAAFLMIHDTTSVYSYVEDSERACGANKVQLEIQHRKALTANRVGMKIRGDRTRSREQLFLDLTRVADMLSKSKAAQGTPVDIAEESVEEYIPFFFKFSASIMDFLNLARAQPQLLGRRRSSGNFAGLTDDTVYGSESNNSTISSTQNTVQISESDRLMWSHTPESTRRQSGPASLSGTTTLPSARRRGSGGGGSISLPSGATTQNGEQSQPTPRQPPSKVNPLMIPIIHSPSLRDTITSIILSENPLTVFAESEHKKLSKLALGAHPFRRLFNKTEASAAKLNTALYDKHFTDRIIAARRASNAEALENGKHKTNLNLQKLGGRQQSGSANNSATSMPTNAAADAVIAAAIPTVVVYDDPYEEAGNISEIFRNGKGDVEWLISDDEEDEQYKREKLSDKDLSAEKKRLENQKGATLLGVVTELNKDLKKEADAKEAEAKYRQKIKAKMAARAKNGESGSSSSEETDETDSEEEELTQAEIARRKAIEEQRHKDWRERDTIARFVTYYLQNAPSEAVAMATQCPNKLLQALSIHRSHQVQRALIRKRLAVLIDPIDGTNAFTQGDRFAPLTLVGVALDGEPVMGVTNRILAEDDGKALDRSILQGLWAGSVKATPASTFLDMPQSVTSPLPSTRGDPLTETVIEQPISGTTAAPISPTDVITVGGTVTPPPPPLPQQESRTDSGVISSGPLGGSVSDRRPYVDSNTALVNIEPRDVDEQASQTYNPISSPLHIYATTKAWEFKMSKPSQPVAPVHPLSYCLFALGGAVVHSVVDGELVDTSLEGATQRALLRRFDDEAEEEIRAQQQQQKEIDKKAPFAQRIQLVVSVSSTTQESSLQSVTNQLHPLSYVSDRGAGNKLLTVAKGLADVMAAPPLAIHKWDTCAPHAFLRCVGGDLMDPSGRSVCYPTVDYEDSPMAAEMRRQESMASARRVVASGTSTARSGTASSGASLKFTNFVAFSGDATTDDNNPLESQRGPAPGSPKYASASRRSVVKVEVPDAYNLTNNTAVATGRRSSIRNTMTEEQAADVYDLTELPTGVIACHNQFIKRIVLKRITALSGSPERSAARLRFQVEPTVSADEPKTSPVRGAKRGSVSAALAPAPATTANQNQKAGAQESKPKSDKKDDAACCIVM